MLKNLFKMKRLRHVNNINRPVDFELVELDLGQAEVFGRVQPSAVGLFQNAKAEIFFAQVGSDAALVQFEYALSEIFFHKFLFCFKKLNFFKKYIKENYILILKTKF